MSSLDVLRVIRARVEVFPLAVDEQAPALFDGPARSCGQQGGARRMRPEPRIEAAKCRKERDLSSRRAVPPSDLLT